MYKNRSILAIIPARGKSKGVPGKNIRDFSGEPLISWTINAVRESKYIDRLILSSEDHRIISIAEKHGCEAPFKRPRHLAGDKTPMADVLIHALKNIPGYDYLVLLQPTSPLRAPEDIDGCIRKCIDNNAVACVSVYKPKANPCWMYKIGKSGSLKPFCSGKRYLRRQELPAVYALNGAVYCAKTGFFIKRRSFIAPGTLGYAMPPERSVDIDSVFDFKMAEAALKR